MALSMRIIILLLLLACSFSRARQSNLVSTISPKLRTLLMEKPAALRAWTNALTEAFSNRTVRLYYFYSDDESEARAFHYYPNQIDQAEVIICVRENQRPSDEFICIFYE